MSDAAALWAEIHQHFDEDDGSRPEINLVGTPPGAIQRILDELLARAEPLTGDDTVWHAGRRAAVALTECSGLGSLVEDGTVPHFHVRLQGIEYDGRQLPDLGFFAAGGEVALDYSMGAEWSAPVLAAFVALLKHLRTLAPGATLTLEAHVPHGHGVVEQFQRAVDAYEP